MENIVSKIKQKKGLVFKNASDDLEISEAEQVLGVKFNKEYREYVSAFGVASFCGHELTGISSVTRLNVVNVTIRERECNSEVSKDWYVIEQAQIDGIVIWQDGDGKIYETRPNEEAVKVCESFSEYVDI